MTQLFSVKIGENVFSPADWTATDNLYSTVEIGAGAQPTLVAFAYGTGGTIPGSAQGRKAELIDTNLQGEGGRLPENEAMLIFSMNTDFTLRPILGVGTDDDNVQAPLLGGRNMLRIQRDTILELIIAQLKTYAQAPIGWYPAAQGVKSDTVTGLGADILTGYLSGTNGKPSVKGSRRFASPQFILGGETFQVKFRFPAGEVVGLSLPGGASDRVMARVTLRGLRKRPVA